MKVQELMCREVRTCRPDDPLSVAAQRMWEGDCGVLPVVDERGAVVGMITDRDVCMAAWSQGLPLGAVKVASAMARRLLTCRVDDELAGAEETMQVHQVRRLPVLDAEGGLAGILSLNDLARACVRPGARGVERDEVVRTLTAICHPHETLREESLVPARAEKTAAAVAG